MKAPPDVRWLAGADGVAHARSRRGRAIHTACGIAAIDERFAHPTVRRCERCLAKTEAR